MNYITVIEEAYENHLQITPSTASKEVVDAVHHTITQLEAGTLRIAEKQNNEWTIHSWIKKAILLYFRLQSNTVIPAQFTQFYDKIPLRFMEETAEEFKALNIRLVPLACVRRGVYVGAQTLLMPSFINIGAYIGCNSTIDIWATIGSGAQIGNHVHISAGACIGGVLEPIQDNPTIIEDNCFIGANSTIVEGVIVEEGSVIAAGVHLGKSTRLYDKQNNKILYARVPKGSVVIPGTLPGDASGTYHVNCGIIIKQVCDNTRRKTAINHLLREQHDNAV